jgi:hypothetical protein
MTEVRNSNAEAEPSDSSDVFQSVLSSLGLINQVKVVMITLTIEKERYNRKET